MRSNWHEGTLTAQLQPQQLPHLFNVAVLGGLNTPAKCCETLLPTEESNIYIYAIKPTYADIIQNSTVHLPENILFNSGFSKHSLGAEWWQRGNSFQPSVVGMGFGCMEHPLQGHDFSIYLACPNISCTSTNVLWLLWHKTSTNTNGLPRIV